MGCNFQPSEPRANRGDVSGASCCTTMAGTPAAWAASMARPILARELWIGGYSIGRFPVTYSFWTSMTINARHGVVFILFSFRSGWRLYSPAEQHCRFLLIE